MIDNNYQNLLSTQIWNNSGQDYLLAVGVFVVSLLILKIFQVVVLRALKKAAQKTNTDFDDALVKMVEKIRPPFYFLVSLYVGLRFLTLPEILASVINDIFIVVVAYQIIKTLQDFIDYGAQKFLARAENKGDGDVSAIKNISVIFKIVLWALAVLVVLSNLGVNITSLVAGLGIGGIAIALAAQNILGDIFSSFSIFIDKPFVVGDFIVVGEHKGVVEKIGIKTTRIRSNMGEEIVVSNQELTSTRIQNYKRMKERRNVFALGVTYETPTEKLKMIPKMIKDIVEPYDLARFDRAHFSSYGDFSLNFEVSYFALTSDYAEFMNIKQEINFKIKEAFEGEGIDFAYPTRTLFLKKS